MSKEFNLSVDKRDLTNKGGRKRNLREGKKIPGIYYSHDSKESIPFYIDKKEIVKAQKADSQIFNITVGSKKRNVLFKSVQYHPVTDEIMHIDLYGIKMDQMVSVSVPVNIIGTAKGVVEGGVMVQSLNELEIECLPMDIPSTIDIDVSALEIGDSFKVEDAKTVDNLEVKSNANQIIISITQAMKEEASDVVADELSTEEDASSDTSIDSSAGDDGDKNKEDTEG